MSQHEQSIDSLVRWDDGYDARCVARLNLFRQQGVNDAKSGRPMLRTFENLGSGYCSAEGTHYERGYRSIVGKEDEAEVAKQRRLF